MTQFQILCKLVPRHSYTPGNLHPDGKNCAVPVLHRDYFVAKEEAQWPALRQVTPTNFIAGPLAFIYRPLRDRSVLQDSIFLTIYLDTRFFLFIRTKRTLTIQRGLLIT